MAPLYEMMGGGRKEGEREERDWSNLVRSLRRRERQLRGLFFTRVGSRLDWDM